MAKAQLTYEMLKREALALPEVEASTSYGDPALKVRGKLMARRREDLGAVALRMNWEERDRLMTVYPEVFFITEHYPAAIRGGSFAFRPPRGRKRARRSPWPGG